MTNRTRHRAHGFLSPVILAQAGIHFDVHAVIQGVTKFKA
jgi:hypothetical protein